MLNLGKKWKHPSFFSIISSWLSVIWATDNWSLDNTEVVEMPLAAYICSWMCFWCSGIALHFENSSYRPELSLSLGWSIIVLDILANGAIGETKRDIDIGKKINNPLQKQKGAKKLNRSFSVERMKQINLTSNEEITG